MSTGKVFFGSFFGPAKNEHNKKTSVKSTTYRDKPHATKLVPTFSVGSRKSKIRRSQTTCRQYKKFIIVNTRPIFYSVVKSSQCIVVGIGALWKRSD